MGRAPAPRRDRGAMPDGRAAFGHRLDNGRGLRLCAINYGGIVTALHCPDRTGRSANVVLGFATLPDYLERIPNFGILVGRYANRIAGGRFTLDVETYRLAQNDGTNTLHGGLAGFGKRWWSIGQLPPAADGSVALELSLGSADGDQGFPGRLRVTVRYTSSPASAGRIDYRVTTDRATVVNLSHHGYFNLAGTGNALGHELTLHASRYTTIAERLIPTGVAEVAGTPFDVRQPTRIGERIREAHEQLLRARGYDHNWILDAPTANGADALHPAARLFDPISGPHPRHRDDRARRAVLLRLLGAAGFAYRQGDGVCLETQHFPDSPNRPEFPSTVLRPGQTFTSSTIYRFSCDAP